MDTGVRGRERRFDTWGRSSFAIEFQGKDRFRGNNSTRDMWSKKQNFSSCSRVSFSGFNRSVIFSCSLAANRRCPIWPLKNWSTPTRRPMLHILAPSGEIRDTDTSYRTGATMHFPALLSHSSSVRFGKCKSNHARLFPPRVPFQVPFFRLLYAQYEFVRGFTTNTNTERRTPIRWI